MKNILNVLCICLCCFLFIASGCTKRAPLPKDDTQWPETCSVSTSAFDYLQIDTVKGQSASDNELDDYVDSPVSEISDPLESWNRFWFCFNDIFYIYVAKPIYKGFTAVTPQELRTGLKNFFRNLYFPIRFVNCLLQGKPKSAGVEFGRFVINSTVGFGGLIDVAKGRKTIVPVDERGEDFGQTLGYWGVGDGFYVVLPFIGPSSLRDGIGWVVDAYSMPLNYVSDHQLIMQGAVTIGNGIANMDTLLDTYESVKGIAVDPYVAAREAFISYRNAHINQ